MAHVLEAPVRQVKFEDDDQQLQQNVIRLKSYTRYAWCPLKDIKMTGPMGLQYRNGHMMIKRGQLVPFVNVDMFKPKVPPPKHFPGAPPTILEYYPKYADESAYELQQTYSPWGYTVLEPLTGIVEADAFAVFQVIQPIAFRLENLEFQLKGEATKRINGDSMVDISGIQLNVHLPERLRREDGTRVDGREIAKTLQQVMLRGYEQAKRFAMESHSSLLQDMASFTGTKKGKSAPDDFDVEMAEQLGFEVPALIYTGQENKEADEINARILQTLTDLVARGAQEKETGRQGDVETGGALLTAVQLMQQMMTQMKQQQEEMAALMPKKPKST